MTSTPQPSDESFNGDNPVIILSRGRSGTTLLMRLLNCSPDLIIWGEHAGFIKPLTRAFNVLTSPWATESLATSASLRETVLANQPVILAMGRNAASGARGAIPADENDIPLTEPIGAARWSCEWVNAFDQADITRAFRNLILELLAARVPPSKRWGFKEIRYFGIELEFLRKLFPRAQFILLLRHPVAVLDSVARHFIEGGAKQFARYVLEYLWFVQLVHKQLQEQRRDVLVSHYELLNTQPDVELSRIEQFLGTRLNREYCQAILQERTPVLKPLSDLQEQLTTLVDNNEARVERYVITNIANRYRALFNAAAMQPIA